MKKKNLIYYFPFIIGLSFYLFISILGDFSQLNILGWLGVCLLALAGVLLSKGKWYGICFGLVVGGLLIYSSFFDKGQIVNEFYIGIILCVYYVACLFLLKKTI